ERRQVFRASISLPRTSEVGDPSLEIACICAGDLPFSSVLPTHPKSICARLQHLPESARTTICSTPRRRGRRICWTGRSCGWVSCRCELAGARLIAGGKGELHGLQSSDLLGGIEKLNGHEPPGFVVIQDQSGSRLIALRHFAWAKNDRQGIRLFVVDH